MSNFKERLKQALESSGARQIDVTVATGIPKAAISNYLAGRYEPDEERINILADFFGVSPAWLACYTDDPIFPETNNIKKLRLANNLTQAELAAIAGVSDKAVSTWEQGLKNPRKSAIYKLSDYFNVSPAYLEGYTDDPTAEGGESMEEKLVFKIPRPVKVKEGKPVIRITAEAYAAVEEISAKTGLSNSFVASRMIEFAAKNTEIVQSEDVE